MGLVTLEILLSNISIWSILLPIIVGFGKFPRLNSESRIILYIVILAAIPQILRAFIDHSDTLNILYNLYTFIEYILIALLFYKIEPDGRKIYYFNTIIYALIVCYFVINYGIADRFLHELVSINNFFYILWILLVIVKKHNSDDSFHLFDLRYPLFWYMSGLLFYSICTFIIFLMWGFIKSHPKSMLTHLWIIHYIFNINMYLAFSIGMYKSKRGVNSYALN